MKRNARDIAIANGHMYTRRSESCQGNNSNVSSKASSRGGSRKTSISNSSRFRPDSAFAVLQGNILAQKQKKLSLITLRKEKQELDNDISTIRNLM